MRYHWYHWYRWYQLLILIGYVLGIAGTAVTLYWIARSGPILTPRPPIDAPDWNCGSFPAR
jgi:hypothetical protein